MQEAGERCGSLPYSWPNHDVISREAYLHSDCCCCNYTGKGARTIYSPFNSRTRGGDPHRKKSFFCPSLLFFFVMAQSLSCCLPPPPPPLSPKGPHFKGKRGSLFLLLAGGHTKKLLVPPASYFLLFSFPGKKVLSLSQGKKKLLEAVKVKIGFEDFQVHVYHKHMQIG